MKKNKLKVIDCKFERKQKNACRKAVIKKSLDNILNDIHDEEDITDFFILVNVGNDVMYDGLSKGKIRLLGCLEFLKGVILNAGE